MSAASTTTREERTTQTGPNEGGDKAHARAVEGRGAAQPPPPNAGGGDQAGESQGEAREGGEKEALSCKGEPEESAPNAPLLHGEPDSDPSKNGVRPLKNAGGSDAGHSASRGQRPRGFIQRFSKVPRPIYEASERDLVGLCAHDKHLWRHVLSSTGVRRDEYGDPLSVPVYCRLISRELPSATPLGLVEMGLLGMNSHSIGGGRSREYWIPPEYLAEYLALEAEAVTGDCEWVNLFDGRPTEKKAKSKTRDDKGTKYPKLVADAMRAIEIAYYNRPVAEQLVAEREYEYLRARDRVAALTNLDLTEALQAVQTAKSEGAPDPFPSGAMSAINEAQRLLGRWCVDAKALSALASQAVEHVGGGVWKFTPAYVPQSTGRITDVGGRLQSATREMKAAAFSGFEGVLGERVRNYDLKSSQPRLLRREFEEAGVSTHNLEALLLASSKYEHASRVGVEVGAWKGALMAVVMGAVLFESYNAGTTPWGEPRGDAVQIIADGCLEGKEASACYDHFARYVRPLYEDLKAWRKWLVDVWVPQNAVYGHGGKQFVRNETGQPFCIDDCSARELPRRLAAFVLQGREASFIHTLTALQAHFDFLVIANEHDGLVTVGEIPEEAIRTAREMTGLHDAELVEKSFLG